MAVINKDTLIIYMDAYKKYLSKRDHLESNKPLADAVEDYKRGVASNAAKALDAGNWSRDDIGSGRIGECAIRAVQRHQNLIGRFQASGFSNTIRDNTTIAEEVLFDLYHEHKEQECFVRICRVFGRKYDLVSYLYFIIDPGRYLPLRANIFDEIFSKLGIDLQTSGRCSWENYQAFLATVSAVRDMMQDHFNDDDIDLLDAHSFLWTISQDVLKIANEEKSQARLPEVEKKVEVGAVVVHKEYGEGTISKLSDENVYVSFSGKLRIFPYPDAFDKEYLRLN